MTAPEILRAAAKLIDKPGAWTQDAYARDARGNDDIMSTSAAAVCWCMDGALRRVGLGKAGYDAAVHHLIEACAPSYGWTGRCAIQEWNDAPGQTQAACVAKMLEAAEMAEKAP